jgi:hypothetical protein
MGPGKRVLIVDPVAEREEIEEFADRRVNARGERGYLDTYQLAREMKEHSTVDKIRETLLKAPNAPVLGKDGVIPLAKRKEFEAEKRMAAIREKAIQDALKGKKAAY